MNPKAGCGTQAEGGLRPIPFKLKVTHTIGRNKPPNIYVTPYGGYSFKTEIGGEICIGDKQTPSLA